MREGFQSPDAETVLSKREPILFKTKVVQPYRGQTLPSRTLRQGPLSAPCMLYAFCRLVSFTLP